MAFETDSGNYEVLAEAAKNITGVPGLVLEIGTRRAGSTKIIIDALEEPRHLICLDPYGNIPYPHGDNTYLINDYTNSMKNDAFANLFHLVKNRRVNLIPILLEDYEFFARYHTGVPVYEDNAKQTLNEYALVFFDGPHSPSMVLNEAKFFAPRAVIGAYFVFDDWQDFTFQEIGAYLVDEGFFLVTETPKKKSFKKVA